MPPPHEDTDCHRPMALTLDDYTRGFMVRTRESRMTSVWRSTFSDREAALREVRLCIEERLGDNLVPRFREVALWQDGKPVEIWRFGRPQMGSGVTA